MAQENALVQQTRDFIRQAREERVQLENDFELLELELSSFRHQLSKAQVALEFE